MMQARVRMECKPTRRCPAQGSKRTPGGCSRCVGCPAVVLHKPMGSKKSRQTANPSCLVDGIDVRGALRRYFKN